MKNLQVLAFLLTIVAASCASTAGEGDPRWTPLFDGETTKGWRGFKKEAMPDGWEVLDGCLVCTGGGGDILTEGEFDNFILRLEWKIGPKGNSGIFFRVSEDHGATYFTGPEFQVLDNAGHGDGRSTKTSAGANYALHAPVRDATRPLGEFNEVEIEVRGDYVRHSLNGVELLSYRLWTPEWEALVAGSKFVRWPRYGRNRKGYIALQDHGDEVWYRNIRIQRLPRE